MTTELLPPSGLHYKGTFVSLAEREVELLLNIRTLTREVEFAKQELIIARDSGETDLFGLAQQIRSCQDDLAVAEQNYADYIRDTL